MEKFNTLKGIPANLPMINVDTDMIIPKQFLKTIKRTGLGKSLFFEMRYEESGKKNEEFVLNKKPYNNSSILIVFKNCLGIIISVSTLIIGKLAGIPVKISNFFISIFKLSYVS